MEPDKEIASVVSVQEYLAIFRRRRKVILQAFILFSVVGMVVTLMMQPVYQSSAKLLVEAPSLRMSTVDASNPLTPLLALPQPQAVETQVEVLQSQPLLDKVRQETGFTSLSVRQIRDTNVIDIVAEAHKAEQARKAANLLLELYMKTDADQDLVEILRAKDFVTTQEAAARKELIKADNELKEFKKTNKLADLLKDRDDQSNLVTSLKKDLQSVSSDLASTRAQTGDVRRQLSREPESVTATLYVSNPAIADAQRELHTLQARRESLVQPGGFTSKSREVGTLDAQIADQQKYLDSLPRVIASQSGAYNGVRDSLRNKLATLSTQQAALQTQYDVLNHRLVTARAAAAQFPDWEVTYEGLQRAHDDALAHDKLLADKLTDLSLREKATHATARVIEPADTPEKPVRPKKLLNILLSCVLGLFAGCILAMLQEYLDDRINSEEDAERVLGLISLGRIPPLSGSQSLLLPQMSGMDSAAESYRILRTNIHFASIDKRIRSLQITSSAPGEGKTTTSANLAFAMVQDGKKVILVDTDLRRPSLHTLLEISASPGLTDVLLGRATVDEALQRHPDMPDLLVMPVGAIPPNPAELLGSRALKEVVAQLIERADLVIFDSPPVLVAADAQILAAQMDGVVMVVETSETRKGAAKHTIKLLRQARANILGIAYNMMMVQPDGSGYYNYYYYHPYTSHAPDSLTTNGTGSDSGGNLVATKERSRKH
jgi:succinoglycan biosynthesis transport protein ExoP